MEVKVPPVPKERMEGMIRDAMVRDAASRTTSSQDSGQGEGDDVFEGFDEPQSTEEKSDVGEWAGDAAGTYDNGLYHGDQAQTQEQQTPPAARPDWLTDAQSDDLVSSTAAASDVPINIVGEDGSETPVGTQSGQQSGQQS